MKHLVQWHAQSPGLQQVLTQEDVHPVDRQALKPVLSLFRALPELRHFASICLPDQQKSCEKLIEYIEVMKRFYDLFSDNQVSVFSSPFLPFLILR